MSLFNHIGALFFYINKIYKKNDKEEEEVDENSILCRFILDGTGEKVGESIAIDEDLMIIKTGKNYLGIPLKHIEENEDGKTLLVKGLLDRDKAKEMGENWRKRSFTKIANNQEA